MKSFFHYICFGLALGISAAPKASAAVPAGNLILPVSSIEHVLRHVIAQAVSGKVSETGVGIKAPAHAYTLTLPKFSPELDEVLTALGIQKTLLVSHGPIAANLTLPGSSLRLELHPITSAQYQLDIEWRATEFTANASQVAIRIPKGLFDQAFDVTADPVSIGLFPGSNNVRMNASVILNLSEAGTTMELKNLTSNLNTSDHPILNLQYGPLSVNGKPLDFEIISNGQSLKTNETHIRRLFDRFYPELMDTLRTQLATQFQTQSKAVAQALKQTPPLIYHFSSDEAMAGQTAIQESLSPLLTGFNATFFPSMIEKVNWLDAFSIQIGSDASLDGRTLPNVGWRSAVNAEDIKGISRREIGILIQESYLQTVFRSAAYKARMKRVFGNVVNYPGVSLGDHGIVFYFNTNGTFDLEMNLVIDISETQQSGSTLGSFMEETVGAGGNAVVPVEIGLKPQGIIRTNNTYYLQLATTLPFVGDSIVIHHGGESNLSKMTSTVRGRVLSSLASKLKEMVPATVRIPLGSSFSIGGIRVWPKRLLFTSHANLLLVGGTE